MDRSRRQNTKRTPHEKFAELRALRESGKTRGATYETETLDDLYEEVDEEAYKKVVRERLAQDDFVVDDGGEGYVDNGMDDWGDREEREGSWDDSEEDVKGKKGKANKRKREAEDKERKKQQEGSISKYFSSTNVVPTIKAKPVTTEEDKDFMNSLLGEFDNKPVVSTSYNKRRIKEEPSRKTRRLSPPRREPAISNKQKWRNNDEYTKMGIPSSPPLIGGLDDDNDGIFAQAMDDYDVSMSDVPVAPSSPLVRAAQKKLVITDDDSDDDLAVAEITGHKIVRDVPVNLSSTRASLLSKPESLSTPAASSPNKASQIDSSAWTNVTGGLNIMNTPAQNNTASIGKLGPEDATEEDGSIKMFWLDYAEINGALILFGKIKDKRVGKYVSAFLKLDGLMRNLYFLPREKRVRFGRETDEDIEMSNVHEEVSELFEKQGIDNFKAKSSSRKYAFEVAGVPREGDYLKVLYPYTQPILWRGVPDKGGETFSHLFGINTALFEQFVLCRNIMGPCWLKIEGADFSAVRGASWCKLEIQVAKPQHITPLGDSDSSETPPLTLMSIALRTSMNVKENKQEIIAASCRIYENVSLTDATSPEKLPSQTFTVVRPVNQVFPPGFDKIKERHQGNIRLETTENMLLSTFLAKLLNVDPDVLIGHQLENVDYSILLHRMKERKTPNWSRLGRMKRSTWPSYGGKLAGSFFAERQLVAGRLMCDLANDLGKSLMTKCQSWSLTEMCELILAEKRQDLDNEDALKTWANSAKGLLDYLIHCEVDTYFIAAVALKTQMLPLTKQLTNLAGNSWARTMSGTRAERNEYILLHEFYRNKYLCPDKMSRANTIAQKNAARNEDEDGEEETTVVKKKDKFKGGLVFDPEKGLYDKFIIVMDFNSLYPSIIQEYNICFTTVERDDQDEEKIPDVPEEQTLGVLPRLISTLVKRRKAVKGLMKDKGATAVQKSQWDIKQQALKLTANSMYGCLGYVNSRFYARPLAMLVTFKGREILRSTKDLAESLHLRVIYGDTDSVMINTNCDNYADAIKIGNEFKKQVNDRYKLLEIDIDNVFERLLLHAKKKYAAVNYFEINGRFERKMEVKGLDMRRREYCQLSKDASSHILNEIFSGDETEVVVERIHEYLRELSEKIRGDKFPTMKYIIYTKLGKNPEQYPGGQFMPQVQVALRKKSRGEPVKIGDVISYIITEETDATRTANGNYAQRAYAPQDLIKADSGLKPDPEWYLIKQIYPPIERLCGPIDGTDAMRLAQCLGLDTKKYQIVNSSGGVDNEIHPLESTIPDEERFKDAAKLNLRCRSCKESFDFEGLVVSQQQCSADGIVCANASCGKILSVISVIAQLEYQIRQLTAKYYEAWLVCDDSSCGNRTRQMSVYGRRCLGPKGHGKGCRGVMSYEYTDKMLYNQLLYFSSIFDAEKAKLRAKGDKKEEVSALATMNQERFGVLGAAVGRYLEKCGRRWVSMESVFGFAM